MTDRKLPFCVECGERMPYRVSSTREEVEKRGFHLSFEKYYAICEGCGEKLYVPEINDLNVTLREEAYRKAANLITVEEIQELLKRYHIGAGPLAVLLGFGEITIHRYLKGQLPSKAHSDRLREIAASHTEMRRCLIENGDRISKTARAKCAAALDRLDSLYGPGKLSAAARYLLRHSGDITPMALQKLLYYAQGFFYALYHADLFPEDCQAWAYGPVFPEVYQKYRKFGSDPIALPLNTFPEADDVLDARETGILDAVMETFGQYSGQMLSRMTHREEPWIAARGDLPPGRRGDTVMDREQIHAWFDRIAETWQIQSPEDLGRCCRAMAEAAVSP